MKKNLNIHIFQLLKVTKRMYKVTKHLCKVTEQLYKVTKHSYKVIKYSYKTTEYSYKVTKPENVYGSRPFWLILLEYVTLLQKSRSLIINCTTSNTNKSYFHFDLNFSPDLSQPKFVLLEGPLSKAGLLWFSGYRVRRGKSSGGGEGKKIKKIKNKKHWKYQH